ncbi:MAG TPA: membrane protein insertion efficiency factor YidD [Dongiaceae bacterium]|jgi:putative membrane protein insertion efficiency factor|nr:membrane protein insertion efficiency factor YidD [Dongiaceae bacterium]
MAKHDTLLVIPAIAMIRLYQLTLSPFWPGVCRYRPSCSAYAIEAISRHGLAKGCWLGLLRLLRCHPWGGHGHDPVPPLSQ